MQLPSIAEIRTQLRDALRDRLPPFRLVILRNVTLEPLEPYLQWLALQQGLDAQIRFGEFDNIYQEAVGGQGNLLGEDPDCVMVLSHLPTLSPALTRDFARQGAEAVQAEFDRLAAYIEEAIAGIRQQTSALLLWHGFERPAHPALGILDAQREEGQAATIGRLNEHARAALRRQRAAYFLELNLLLCRLGEEAFQDLRYWHIGRAPYSRAALAELAREQMKYLCAHRGKNKKCLVLDCDNTLWGGIVGEDGLAGLKLGQDYPGSTYWEFQHEILNLYHRGVILALCSKNNAEDVWSVFRERPEMVLQPEHISAAQINWDDKATNIKRLAADLNIGLDSMVFLDDSPFEINLVQELLPEVLPIQLPAGRPAEYRHVLAACGLFDTLTLTVEDKQRGQMYRQERAREELRTTVPDLQAYYRSLEMDLAIHRADEKALPRVAQLTQRTNQFNLTTRRYSEADIQEFVGQPNTDVLYLQLRDRFGDYGIVGVAILLHDTEQSTIDTMLLSCRVLGRGVEGVFFRACADRSRQKGLPRLVSSYLPSRKNAQVASFYEESGMQVVARSDDQVAYQLDSDQTLAALPDYFHSIEIELEE